MSFSRHQGFFKKAIGSNEEQIEKCKVQQNSVYNMQYNKKSLEIAEIPSRQREKRLVSASQCGFSVHFLACHKLEQAVFTDTKMLNVSYKYNNKKSLEIGKIPYRQREKRLVSASQCGFSVHFLACHK